MLTEKQKVFKITAAGTQNVVNKTCYFLALIGSVVTAGGLSITIQDKATAPNKLLPAIDLTPPGGPTGPFVKDYTPPRPVRMEGGMDIVNAGAGEVYLWIWYLYEPDPQT